MDVLVDPAAPRSHSWLQPAGQASPKSLFRTAEPGELGVQDVDGGGGGFPRCGACRYHCGWYRHQGAADSLVVAVGPAAAGSEAAQLLWRLAKEDMGHVTTFISSGGPT
jgi:hypothetical protein